jgi:2-iminobutanoate/2-iminopropanoate deaminase
MVRRKSGSVGRCDDPTVNSPVNPRSIAPPAAHYSHAVLSTGAERLLHSSGVVPVAPDGAVPPDLAEQAEVVWTNIETILREADMAVDDVVSITTYVVQGAELGPVMAVRDRVMGGHLPASTLVVVPSLARPEWRLEIAVIAAR